MKNEELKAQIEAIIKQEMRQSNDGTLWGEDTAAELIYDLLPQQQPTPSAKIAQVWNAITANGCREMDFERFQQAVKELAGEQQAEPVSEEVKPGKSDARWQSIECFNFWIKLENGAVYDYDDNWARERKCVTHWMPKPPSPKERR